MIENTFGKNIIPENDVERLNALKRYRIMDTPSEECFDHIAKLATQIFKVPISLISLVDAERVFFKANIGMGRAREANRGKSLCALAVLAPEVTVFEDALKEPCLIANPNVAGDFGLRFYAGAPLVTNDGFLIGTLCIIDKTPRLFSKDEQQILAGLAETVMDQVDLRLSALDELEKQTKQREETHALNEELTATNEELRSVQEHLHQLNIDLSEREQRFRNLVKQAPMAITIYSGPELVIEQANEAMLAMLGRTEEIIGLPLLTARPELKGHPNLEIIERVRDTGTPYTGLSMKAPIRQNGQVIEKYFDVIYKPLTEQNGEVSGIIAIGFDVTEKTLSRERELEMNEELAAINEEMTDTNAELRLLAQQLSYVNNTIPQQVWTATPDGLLDFVNEQTITYFGRDPETLIGENWIKVVHPDDLPDAGAAWAYALSTGEPYQTEFRLLSKNGDYVWHLARAVAFKENGKIIKWFGTNTDINGQKLLEQHKTDFISIASHELKTPITSLKASIALLDRLKNQPSPMIPKLIDQANRGVKKISSLVDDLLSVSRINEGQLHIRKTAFNVKSFLEDCCSALLITEDQQLIIEGDSEQTVHADEHLIEQVVINLVNNALKYAPDSPSIHMQFFKEKELLKIGVTDKGPGIGPEKLPHLFDRYYRADHSGHQYSGLGLGLYICAQIIEKHGGQIYAESQLEKGSTFWFTLPL